eukprot:CAMPEP_0119014714 /NCGR_PEP_ID=MMETSP1176-20130426/10269_1 /TAXON_ID=265551 /ORGANISM="Synedropsis recta cf, Strain CCMP1620" /LENGTH=181 /DNA_ID=CAMNT_0006967937 /DNA_START=17 /DNA_END=562 /DNA_ORIENTATION=+
MVKHGKDKKRRAGRYGKSTLKNKNFKRWDPNPKIGDAAVKKLWDPSKSPEANLATMGLTALPNGPCPTTKITTSTTTSKATTPVIIELFDIPDSDNLECAKTKRIMPLSAVDQDYIAKCLTKHGADNYKKMFMDIKTNDMQLTEKQLRKLASRFVLLDPEQRSVDVPANVQHLVSSSSSSS